MRERLIELLKEADERSANRLITDYGEAIEDNADYLLANGVIVPPCKVGDTCWYIRHYLKSYIIVGGVVEDAVYTVRGGWVITMEAVKNHFHGRLGETVFLTREEAEKALEGRKA